MTNTAIPTYILYSKHEPTRAEQVGALQAAFPNAEIVEPVFPKFEKVPFLNKLIQKSKERTGSALLPSEIGVLMSHRRIWQKIVMEAKYESKRHESAMHESKSHEPKPQRSIPLNSITNKHYLILESDSKLNDAESLCQLYPGIEKEYDLFFWGAWNNHVSIKRSTSRKFGKYKIGEPMIRSVYGAYGYSLNAFAAQKMLDSTSNIKYPVDLYKHYAHLGAIEIGAIQKELISTWQTTDSTIRLESEFDKVKRKLKIRLFSFRNQIQAYFC